MRAAGTRLVGGVEHRHHRPVERGRRLGGLGKRHGGRAGCARARGRRARPARALSAPRARVPPATPGRGPTRRRTPRRAPARRCGTRPQAQRRRRHGDRRAEVALRLDDGRRALQTGTKIGLRPSRAAAPSKRRRASDRARPAARHGSRCCAAASCRACWRRPTLPARRRRPLRPELANQIYRRRPTAGQRAMGSRASPVERVNHELPFTLAGLQAPKRRHGAAAAAAAPLRASGADGRVDKVTPAPPALLASERKRNPSTGNGARHAAADAAGGGLHRVW